MIIWDWACNQLPGLPPKQWMSRKCSQGSKQLNQESQSIRSWLFSFSTKLEKHPNGRAEHLASSVHVWAMYVCEPSFKELLLLVKGKTVSVMTLPRDKSQTWFKAAEIEEQADVRSYMYCIKWRQKMGKFSAETADISARAESHSTTHNLERLL